MAKMFYTLEEAAERLGTTPDEVVAMANSGQLQEFRDRDKLMFKVEQVDLLAGGGDDEGPVELLELADSGEQDALEVKEESVLGLEDEVVHTEITAEDSSEITLADSKESTGISIFDADELETADPSAVTQVSETMGVTEFSVESGASGSGLLDLTREADDTSLGADLLDEIYTEGRDDQDQAPALGLGSSAAGLFAESDAEAAAPVGEYAAGAALVAAPVAAYDPGWNGAAVGLGIGALAALIICSFILLTAVTGTVAGLAATIAANYMVVMGALAGATILFGIIGYFVGRSMG